MDEHAHLKKHPIKKRNFQHPTVGRQSSVPTTKATKWKIKQLLLKIKISKSKHVLSWTTERYQVNLCKGPRDIQVNKQDALAVRNGTLYVSLPDCHKLVGTMFGPVSPQINWISKIVSFCSKFLQNLLECSLAHLSSSNPCSTSFSTHWKWIHWYASGATSWLPATTSQSIALLRRTGTGTNWYRNDRNVHINTI